MSIWHEFNSKMNDLVSHWKAAGEIELGHRARSVQKALPKAGRRKGRDDVGELTEMPELPEDGVVVEYGTRLVALRPAEHLIEAIVFEYGDRISVFMACTVQPKEIGQRGAFYLEVKDYLGIESADAVHAPPSTDAVNQIFSNVVANALANIAASSEGDS